MWGAWTKCNVSCGAGVISRSRTCYNGVAGIDCVGDEYEQAECYVTDNAGFYGARSLGLLAVQLVVAASKPDQSNIHVAMRIMFKNGLVTKMPVITNNGVFLLAGVFTVALAKFKLIPISVTATLVFIIINKS